MMLDLNFYGDVMIGVEWIEEMELFLKQKQAHINIALSYYEMLEDTERQDLLEALFNRIDEEVDQIQELDILFLMKFDKLKKANGILELNELSLVDQTKFSKVKALIFEISEPQRHLEHQKNMNNFKKQEMSKSRIDTKQKTQAFAAYKRTNK